MTGSTEGARNFLKKYDDRIPQEYRDVGWRVLVIASGHTFAGDEAHIAVLQNDSDKAPNGYFNTFGWTMEEAVDGAINLLWQTVPLPSDN